MLTHVGFLKVGFFFSSFYFFTSFSVPRLLGERRFLGAILT